MAAGRQRGEELLAETRLARLRVRRAAEVTDLINMRKQQLGESFQEEQNVSLSGTKEFSNHQQDQQPAMARLETSGLRGGAASANRPIWPENTWAAGSGRTEHFTQNVDRRQQALDAFEFAGKARQESGGCLQKKRLGFFRQTWSRAGFVPQERGAALSQAAAGACAAKRSESKK